MPTLTINTHHNPRQLAYQNWDGERLRSSRHCPLAFDVETDRIEDERRIPRLALAVASDGRSHVVIHADRLADFLLLHRDDHLVGHNVQFDFWALDQHLGQAGDQRTQRVLWDACHAGRLRDTQILDMLLQLGTGRFRKVDGGGKDAETKVYPGNLAEVAAEYTIFRINKDDPYRLRFGELIGLIQEQWADVEPGFIEYAVRDAVVTHRLYPALADAAHKLMREHGFDRKAQRYQIRPDAIDKFGYLSEIIQVKASVVLAYMFRRGVHVDLTRARELEDTFLAELENIVTTLERDYRDVLTFGKDGKIKLTSKGQTPSMGTAKLKAMLLRAAEEIKAGGHDVQVPMSTGKKPDVSRSVKAWEPYAERHPFLRCWSRLTKLSKLLSLLANITAEIVHGQYHLLMRTGRTSCSAPRSPTLPGLNLQQIPKLPEFRALFRPAPGYKLFTGDFSAAELRTLAAVCKARYGYSKLGEVIAKDIDPHAYTAAAIQGMPLDDFMALKTTEPKQFKNLRQAAKAINFGIPGGLGAKALVAYARAQYGVTMTLEEAERFRLKLINEIYTELNDRDGYLADEGMAALASNLGVTEREVWEAFDRRGKKNPIAARGVAKVIKGKSTASNRYQQSVWDGLLRLAQVSRSPDQTLMEQIARKKGGQALHSRLYRQSAVTLTGRIRAGVGYADGKNTPFQSLCACGAKLALWNLLYEGFDVYMFVHDETVVQVRAETAEEDARRASEIKVRSMEEVMGQGIPAACEYGLTEHWAKP